MGYADGKKATTLQTAEVTNHLSPRTWVAETVGTGFVVPSAVRPMRPRKRKEEAVEVAA